MLFIYFKVKQSFLTASSWSSCFEFLYWFISCILLSKMNAIFQPLKFCQIPHVILESTNQFFFKFCISLQCHQTKLRYTFLAQTLYTLFKRNLLKCKFLRLWEVWSKFVKFFMSILKRQVNSSSNFASFFIVVTHNSSVAFKLILFLLWI